VTIGLFLCAALPARATEPFAKVGKTYGEQWLQFPRGVRNIGMGATGTADVSGTATGYFNPAVVAFTDATTFLGSYEDMFANISLSDAIVISPIPFRSRERESAWHLAGAFGYSRESMEPQIERTIFLPEGTGRTFDASEWALTAIAAGSWTKDGLSLGAGTTTKYLHSNYGSADLTGWAFDLGAVTTYSLNHSSGAFLRPRVGYARLNLDNGMTYDGREYVVANEQRIGMGLDIAAPLLTLFHQDVHVFSIAVDYDWIDREGNSPTDYSAGFEVTVTDLIHLRTGVIDDQYSTYGVGLGWDNGKALFRVDYVHAEPKSGYLLSLVGPELDRDTVGLLVGGRW
jgi:hypothetical protein